MSAMYYLIGMFLGGMLSLLVNRIVSPKVRYLCDTIIYVTLFCLAIVAALFIGADNGAGAGK